MAKASDNVFPSILLAEGAAPTTPSAGQHRLFVDTADDKLKRKDSAGTVSLVEGGGGGLLARTSYNPGTIAAYTTTSTTLVDLDATNLAVTFTVPASGSVLITLEGAGGSAGTDSDSMSWGLREATTNIAPASIVAGGTRSTGSSAGNSTWSKTFLVTGLTPGASKTYKWAWCANTGTNTCRMFAGGVAGAAHIFVSAA